ncbi:MAG: hypothetical protein HRT47_12285 [Candidatus Caenarcaniphilales bacterium]|nr:hypothetical protein [Candidatus Caenarcaniphilales bacterium]
MDNLISFPSAGRSLPSVKRFQKQAANPYVRSSSASVSNSKVLKLHKPLVSKVKNLQSPTVMVLLNGSPSSNELEDSYLTIGSGREVPSLATKISNEIRNENFFNNAELVNSVNHVKKSQLNGYDSKLNLMGLVSTKSPYAELRHMYALIELARRQGLKDSDIKLNLIVDGAGDTPGMAQRVIKRIRDQYPDIEISSLTGRDIAIDDAVNDSKSKAFFRALTVKPSFQADSPQSALDQYFSINKKSEKFMPTFLTSESDATPVSKNDSLVFFNTKLDRKQIAVLFRQMEKENNDSFRFTALGDYGLKNAMNIAYKQKPLLPGFVKVLNDSGKKIKELAQPENPKLFDLLHGGNNKQLTNVTREFVSGSEIIDKTLNSLSQGNNDLTLVNLDTSTPQAKLSVENQLERIKEKVKSLGGKLIVTSVNAGASNGLVPVEISDFSKSGKEQISNNSIKPSEIAGAIIRDFKVTVPEYMEDSRTNNVSSPEIWWTGWRLSKAS